jgi:glycosyltransferase involved in cell wall biosynthesis
MTSNPSDELEAQGWSLAALFIRAVDLALAAAAMLAFAVVVLPLLVLRGRLRSRPSPRRILHLVNGSIDATKWRNGLYYYGSKGLMGDLDGYFERVVTVFFLTRGFRTERVTERCELIDFHLDQVAFLEGLGLSTTRVVLNTIAHLVFSTWLSASERVGVIQVADPYVSGLNGWILSVLTGARLSVLVMSNYDLHFEPSGRPMYSRLGSRRVEKLIERRVFQRAELVLADRIFYARYATDNGCDPRQVRVVPATVHQDFYLEPLAPRDARARFGLNEDDPVLLYVGRLHPEKHVLDLPEVLACARKVIPGTKLLVAGDGVLREELRDRAQELGVREEILLPGPLDIENLRMAYAAADVVLGTHMGFTLLEAALSGRPIVAYDWEWHPEVVENSRTGVLVPFGDRVAMAAAAASILDDRCRARELGNAARRTALERYAIGRNVERLREAYLGLGV